MKVGFVVAVGGAAIVAAGLAGCSSEEKKSDSPVAGDKGTSIAEKSSAMVMIDGQDQKVEGTVVCTEQGEDVIIAIGNTTGGIGATVSKGDSPAVKQVGLGNVNGMALGFTEGVGQGNATAAKDGKTYKISGTAVGVDMANPMQPANKPFEIEVTCP